MGRLIGDPVKDLVLWPVLAKSLFPRILVNVSRCAGKTDDKKRFREKLFPKIAEYLKLDEKKDENYKPTRAEIYNKFVVIKEDFQLYNELLKTDKVFLDSRTRHSRTQPSTSERNPDLWEGCVHFAPCT